MPTESERARRASLREIRFAIETSVKLVAKTGAPGSVNGVEADRRARRCARRRARGASRADGQGADARLPGDPRPVSRPRRRLWPARALPAVRRPAVLHAGGARAAVGGTTWEF